MVAEAKSLPLVKAAIISKRTGVPITSADLSPFSLGKIFKAEAMKLAVDRLKDDSEYHDEVSERKRPDDLLQKSMSGLWQLPHENTNAGRRK